MRKWDSEIFKNNHLRLMWCHVGIATFYCGVITWILSSAESAPWFAFVLLSPPLWLHLFLAYGSFKKFELSRKISEFVFAMLLLVFPVGTLLSVFLFLPATGWKKQESDHLKP